MKSGGRFSRGASPGFTLGSVARDRSAVGMRRRGTAAGSWGETRARPVTDRGSVNAVREEPAARRSRSRAGSFPAGLKMRVYE